jgi:hypothetical protein
VASNTSDTGIRHLWEGIECCIGCE